MGYIEKYQHLCWKEEKNKRSGSCRCPKDLALLCDTRPISVHLELVVDRTVINSPFSTQIFNIKSVNEIRPWRMPQAHKYYTILLRRGIFLLGCQACMSGGMSHVPTGAAVPWNNDLQRAKWIDVFSFIFNFIDLNIYIIHHSKKIMLVVGNGQVD